MGFRAALICWFLVVLAPVARAEDKPWAAGVTVENQKAALELYTQANKAFEQAASPADYKQVLETYARALALWDHPQIRYNIAVCLINLDRTVEAYDNLERAMRFGQVAIGSDLWKQGQSYQKLLAGRVAELEVSAEPGAAVSLDGKPLASGQQRVLSGDHQLVVEKPRFQTETRAIRVSGGQKVTIKIELKPIAVQRQLHRRFAKWLPWTVMGVGAALAIVGAPLMFASRAHYNRYTDDVNSMCGAGCTPANTPASITSELSTAKLDNNLAISAFVSGGAVLATGFVMVVLNQPRLTPVIGNDQVGLAYAAAF
ncbi:hypothetical protein BH11MYX1_BH11MYX1_40830 [soil metagenome]